MRGELALALAPGQGACLLGEVCEMANDSGIQRGEQRQNFGADARPRETSVDVRRIGRERNAVTLEVGDDVLADGTEEGPDDRNVGRPRCGGARRENPEAAQSGAAKETKQHGLGSVPSVVSGRDRGDSVPRLRPRLRSPRCGSERTPAGSAGALLEVAARGDVDDGTVERDAELERKGRRAV
jgi:hypothetical protein